MIEIEYDAEPTKYQLKVYLDDCGSIEAIKLEGNDTCIINLLSPVTFSDIENEVEAAIKRIRWDEECDRGERIAREREYFY